jgi:hypothetical protein
LNGSKRFVTCIFFHLKPFDVDKVTQYTCHTIKGTKDLPSIKLVGVMDVNKLMKKSLSCFSCFCVDDNFLACDNILWTKDWEVDMLIPSNISFIREAMLAIFDEDAWD